MDNENGTAVAAVVTTKGIAIFYTFFFSDLFNNFKSKFGVPSLNEFFSCKNRANINWYSIAICFVIRSDKLQPELFFRLYGSNAKTISFLRITMCLLLYLLIFVSVLFYERSISFCPMCFFKWATNHSYRCFILSSFSFPLIYSYADFFQFV